jgi:DNA-binding NtrC family response regulator
MTTDDFRWQGFFQRCTEPLFLLNRRKRLLFANAAWERLTGRTARECHGLVCRRQAVPAAGAEGLASALWLPADVLHGQPGRARRRVPTADGLRSWCDIEFFPLRDADGTLGVLGRITRVAGGASAEAVILPEELVALRQRRVERYGLDQLASSMPALRRVAGQVRLASQTRVPVLLNGEPGTGKEWVARIIHYQSPDREAAFVALDGAHLPARTLARVMFGEGGLFPRGGRKTVYLKEPSRLPREIQDRLVELLADPDPAGPRVLAGTCVPLGAEVQAGRLLDDLYFALSPMVLELPPLRERMAADLPALIERLLERIAPDDGSRAAGLTAQAWEVFYAYRWPGNLRELLAVLASAGNRAGVGLIDVAHLPAYLRVAVRLDQTPSPGPLRPLPLDRLLEETERRLIQLALARAKGNKSRAAELLDIVYPRLFRRMQALGIEG